MLAALILSANPPIHIDYFFPGRLHFVESREGLP